MFTNNIKDYADALFMPVFFKKIFFIALCFRFDIKTSQAFDQCFQQVKFYRILLKHALDLSKRVLQITT